MLDHYFFNIEFSHMVALFWGTIGLALALETQNDERRTMNETRDDDLAIQRSALSAQRSEGEA